MSKRRLKLWIKKNKTYFIFWEWQTEKCYFSALSEYVWNDKFIKYKIEPILYSQIWTTKSKLEETRKTIFNTIYQKYDWTTEKDLFGIDSKIFIILDTDGNSWYTKNQINTIKNFFKKDKLINVLFSNRDFELYILLHLEYYDGLSLDYIWLIKSKYPDYRKGCDIKLKKIFREIIRNWFDSILPLNIKKLEKHHLNISNNHIKDMIPFSEVYNIFM